MARLLRLSLVSVISFYTFCVLSIYRADAVVITVSLNSYGDVGNSNFRDEALTGSLNGTAFNIPLNPKASNGDLANPAAKASYIAGQIMNNSGLSVALNGNTLTARPKPTQILFPCFRLNLFLGYQLDLIFLYIMRRSRFNLRRKIFSRSLMR